MSWKEDFSDEDYQHYWSLTPAERQQMLEGEPIGDALKALLLYQQGQQWFKKDEFVRTIASYDEALALRPNWHDVWTDRATVLLKVGDSDATIASCDRALELEPLDAQAWSIRGAAFSQLKRYQEAADSCDRALELDENNYQAWKTLSTALTQLGRYKEAIVSYDRVLSLQPDNPQVWGERGVALQKLGQYDAAILSYDQFLQAEPDNYKLWHQRGLALRRLGQITAAIASFDRALAIQPTFYAATRSKLFVLITSGHILHFFTSRKTVVERETLFNDLRNVSEELIKTKLPALVVIALVVLSSTHDRAVALMIAGIFLLITLVGDLIAESRK